MMVGEVHLLRYAGYFGVIERRSVIKGSIASSVCVYSGSMYLCPWGHISTEVDRCSFVGEGGGTPINYSRDYEESQNIDDSGRCWIDARSSEVAPPPNSNTQMH